MAGASKSAKEKKNACEKLSKQIISLEAWIDRITAKNVPLIDIGDYNRTFNKDIALGHSENAGFGKPLIMTVQKIYGRRGLVIIQTAGADNTKAILTISFLTRKRSTVRESFV